MSEEEAFLDRISTFTLSRSIVSMLRTLKYTRDIRAISIHTSSYNWSCKPKQISPPMCAKFGWKVVEKNLMQCTSCKLFLSAEIPPVWNISRYLEAIHRLEESLKNSHHQFCPWKNSPSYDNYLHCKLLQQGKAVEGFEQRLVSLREISNSLPRLLHIQSDSSGFTADDCKQISQLALNLDDNATHSSVILALTGWKKVKENNSIQRISCENCLRIVDLYPSTSTEKDNNVPIDVKQLKSSEVLDENSSHTIEGAPKVKRFKNCEVRPFHPLEQHHSWCPWLHVVSVKESDSEKECLKPAWRTLLDIMRTYISQKSVTSDKNVVPLRQGVLDVKKIIKDWIVTCSN